MSQQLPSTQEHLDIVDIVGRYVILKTGACCVIHPAPVNFDLLSEREQDALISAFAGLLNSLTFPIQVVIHTQQIDISIYLNRLDNAISQQRNDFLKQQMVSYKEYVKRLTSRQDVLDKQFYVVIPYYDSTIKAASKGLFPFNKPTVKPEVIVKKAKDKLAPQVDHIVNQLSRLGVFVEVLEEEKLVELFYDIYNPTVSRTEHLSLEMEDYEAPFTESVDKM